MTGFALDTNILSESRKTRPHGAVVAWLAAVPAADLWIPAPVLAELQTGVDGLRHRDPVRAASYETWIEQLEGTPQVLPMDGACFRIWSQLMFKRSSDRAVDAMIAAIARVHGLTVATRNVKDFARFDVPIENPFDYRSNLK